jgi:hypothetical protein
MRDRPAWARINEVHDGFAASLAERSFVTIA